MYSPNIIGQRLEIAQATLGFTPIYHSRAEVDVFVRNMKQWEKKDEQGNVIFTRDLTRKEHRFILNEKTLCNPPEAPIWMGDYSFKPIGDIKVGDIVIGWERECKAYRKMNGVGNYERLKKSIVLGVFRRKAPVVKVILESGTTIRCTEDHLWSNGATYRSQNPWCTAKVGRILRKVVDIYPNDPPKDRLAHWLGGIYDGEGSGPAIHQSKEANPIVHSAIENALRELGFKYGLTEVNNEGKSGLNRDCDHFYINGGREAYARFALWCKPYKMGGLDKRILTNLSTHPDRILYVIPDGEEEVISMQTTTGNYVAWGYASKNCTCDAAYWLTRYAYLSDETNTSVRFKFRDTQRIYYKIISDLEEKGFSIELIIAKARQQFVTTLTELLVGHRIFFHRDVNAITASADRVKSEEMGRKVLFAYDNLPWWLKRKASRRVETVPGILEFDTLNSRLSIQHGSGTSRSRGGQKTGIGRGTTPTVYHLSEVSAYPNPDQQIEAAIFKAVHASPKVFGVLESTFAGDVGWFPDKYKFAKEQWANGLSRLCPLFFHWPCATDLYPTKTWLSMHPVQDWSNHQIADKIKEQILKAELFMRESPPLAKIFGNNWEMPIEQMWFYFVSYFEHEQSGAMATFLQEMPCDDVEAMQSSYDNVFGKETIAICNTNRDKAFDVYSIVGTAIDSKFDPPEDEIDYDIDRIMLSHTPPRDENTYRWELIPMKYSYYEDLANCPPDKMGDMVKRYLPQADAKLFIYPKALQRDTLETSLGIDTSNGISQDSTVIAGATKGNGLVPDIQIAEFRSEYVNHVEAFAFAFPIALFLRSLNKHPNDILRWPWCGIEQIAAVGDTCQVQLRRMGYPLGRFFRFGRYDSVELNKKSSQKVGWYTVRWSRDLLVGYFIHAIKNGWYKLNSPFTIDECRTFEVHYTSTGKEKMEHSSIAHDDGMFSNAIATFINHDLDTLAERGNKKLMPASEDDMPDVSISPNYGLRMNPNALPSVGNIDQIMAQRREIERFRY